MAFKIKIKEKSENRSVGRCEIRFNSEGEKN